jgi:hypothetical protein
MGVGIPRALPTRPQSDLIQDSIISMLATNLLAERSVGQAKFPLISLIRVTNF